ncbi:MAG TPA: hypothetical protein VIT22_05355 [Pseudoxanthomonas sp.]
MGDYRIRDAQGERALVLVRDDTRVEYRIAGEPTRIWRKTPDGVEMIELHPAERRMVVYAPGDLRTMGVEADWALLTGLVDPTLRARLSASGDATAFAQPLTRYRGSDAQGTRVELDWLTEAGLPVRYCIGQRCVAKHGDEDAMRLRELKRAPAEGAFTSLDGLLEIDHADLGDMGQDAFVRDLSHAEHPAP